MAQPEIDQHEIDVEFESVALGGEGDRLARVAQLEADQLVIADLRHEILRTVEVVAEEHVVAQPVLHLHAIGDRADRHRAFRDRLGDARLFAAFFDERVEKPMRIADAAGDEIVELARRDRFLGRAPPDP